MSGVVMGSCGIHRSGRGIGHELTKQCVGSRIHGCSCSGPTDWGLGVIVAIDVECGWVLGAGEDGTPVMTEGVSVLA